MPSLLYLTPVFSTAGAAASAVCYNIGGVWIWRFHQDPEAIYQGRINGFLRIL